MKKVGLNRYPRTADNKILIEIAAGKIKYLYNHFDRHAPHIRKDLDANLTEYLIDCVTEIGNEDFIIHFMLDRQENDELIGRVKTSIKNYFVYLIARENLNMRRLGRKSVIYLFIGIAILSLSYWFTQGTLQIETYFSHIFTQGLNVAAWVSLWNAIATFLINWSPHRDLIKVYQRISQAEITFSAAKLNSE